MFTFQPLGRHRNIQVGIWIPLLTCIVIHGCNGSSPKMYTVSSKSKPVIHNRSLNHASAKMDMWGGVNHPDLWLEPPERRDAQLEILRDSGIRVIRIVLNNHDREFEGRNSSDAIALENPIGHFHWEVLNGVDGLMASCRARDLQLWIVLGGMDEYVREFGPSGAYDNRAAIEAYTRRIRVLLTHRNTQWGRDWHECDDVVYAWEIADRAGESLVDSTDEIGRTNSIFRAWCVEMSQAVKLLDPDSRVALDLSSQSRFEGIPHDNELWELGQIPMVDIYTLHVIFGSDEFALSGSDGIQSGSAVYYENLRDRIRQVKALASQYHKQFVLVPLGAKRREAGMGASLLFYRTAFQIAEEERIPWIVHRFGDEFDLHRRFKDRAFVLTPNDVVWREAVVPAAQRLAGVAAAN